MLCLVKIIAKENINNMLSSLFFEPKKVVFLYDERYKKKNEIKSIKQACKMKLSKTKVEFIKYDSLSIDGITRSCIKVIHKNPVCYFDITDAGEFSAIGAYLACQKTFTPIFKLDTQTSKLINVYGCNSLERAFEMPKITMDTIMAVNGANVIGHQRAEPDVELFTGILEFCNCIFADIDKWKKLCLFLQTACSKEDKTTLCNFFYSKKTISNSQQTIEFEGEKLLNLAEGLNLIYNLKIDKEGLSFYFRNNKIKRYMTDFGVWLELFCYIQLKRCEEFDDVKMSTKIDWELTRSYFMEVTNEIDITFMSGIRPYFISCKLSEPSSDALQEISIYPSYFGGEDSRSALVVLEKINREKSYIYKRAHDMGICIIDGKDIKNGDFIKQIKSSLKVKQ